MGSTASNGLDLKTASFLTSDEGRLLLDEIASLPGDAPARALALRKRGLPQQIVAGAVEIADARYRARNRFSDAARLFFTRDSLAQATSPGLAAFHADRLGGLGVVADLGCGVGMDAIALAAAGISVIAIERDPVRLVFARANAAARGVAKKIRFLEGDVTALDWQADAVFWDPARRESGPDGHRISRHADRYEPPLSFLAEIRERAPRGGVVKLSPALPDETLDELGDVAVLFLSENRECKEACVLWGGSKRPGDQRRGALLLPDGIVIATDDSPAPIAAATGAFVFDPDPATVRAGALGGVCTLLDAALLTPDDAYLTGDIVPLAGETVRRAASAYRVVETMPYRPRLVGEWLRERGFGRLIVKKRHFQKEPDAVARELGLNGKGPETTLILVRDGLHGGFLAVLCEPYL